MVGCSMYSCSNKTTQGFRLFRFPSEIIRRRLWIQNTKRKDWKPGPGARVCEIHFESNQWETGRKDKWVKLKQDAVPTLIDAPNPPKKYNTEGRKSIYRKITETENILPPNERIGHAYKYGEKKCLQANQKSSASVLQSLSLNLLPDVKQVSQSLAQLSSSHDQLPASSTSKTMFDLEDSSLSNASLEQENRYLRAFIEKNINILREENIQQRLEIDEVKESTRRLKQSLLEFLTEGQLTSLRKEKVPEWDSETIIRSIKLRLRLGIHGYETLRQMNYPFPCVRTLSTRLQNYRVLPGILTNLLEPLVYKVNSLEPADRYCALSIDEMQIDATEDYNKNLKEHIGYISLGDGSKLGNHILVALVRGVRQNWKQVIAVEVTGNNVSGNAMKAFVFKCTQYVEQCGLKILCLTSDMGNNNLRLWDHPDFKIAAQKDGFRKNSFTCNAHEVFVVPDVCHLLKNIRSAVVVQSITISEDVQEAELLPSKVISGEYVRTLWEAEIGANKSLRLLHHLKPVICILPISIKLASFSRWNEILL